MDWRLQSAVANLDGNNILISWDNGEIVHSGEIDVESSYRSIGKMSIGGWRGREEQASECEIARVLVFDRALEEQEVKHYEFILKRMYSIMDYSPESYLDWAMGLLRTGSLMGLVAQEAAEIAISQRRGWRIYQGIIGDGRFSESGYHRALSDFLFRKDDEKFVYHLYMAFFLDPGNPNILADLLRKTSEGNSERILEALNLVEMMCIDGNKRGLEQSLDTLRDKVSNSKNENFSSFYKENEDLLERGRFREFFEETNKFLLEHGSLCSNKLIDRLDEVGERPEIRKLIIDKLNEYSNSRDVIRFSTEYFKFRKRKNVGGFADRIKGATTVMLLSIALERRFEIDWKYPFDIEEVFVCDDYDWTVKNPDLEMDKVVLIDSHFTDDYKEIFGNGKIAEEMELEDKSMEAYCNLYFDRTLLNENGGNFLSENEKLGESA